MIFSQAGFGAGVIALSLGGILAIAGDITAPTSHITVHKLSYSTDPFPVISQDRTVYATGKLIASWDAEIQALEGLEWVAVCSGSGFWEYDGGHKVFRIPFNEWVGDADCFVKASAHENVRACAVYEWSDTGRERKCSEPFKP